MKKIVFAVILSSLIPLSGAMANEGRPAGGPPDRFASELGLTSEQQAQIREIHEKYRSNHEEERRAIEQVLTPEQRAKAEEMRKNFKPGKRPDGPPPSQEGDMPPPPPER